MPRVIDGPVRRHHLPPDKAQTVTAEREHSATPQVRELNLGGVFSRSQAWNERVRTWSMLIHPRRPPLVARHHISSCLKQTRTSIRAPSTGLALLRTSVPRKNAKLTRASAVFRRTLSSPSATVTPTFKSRDAKYLASHAT